MSQAATIETTEDCTACTAGFILCDHIGTERDAEGWCDRCSTPGDLAIDGLVETWCDCQL